MFKKFFLLTFLCSFGSAYSMNDDVDFLNYHSYVASRTRESNTSQPAKVNWSLLAARAEEERAVTLGRSMAMYALALGRTLSFIPENNEISADNSKMLTYFLREYYKSIKDHGFNPDFNERAKHLSFEALMTQFEKEVEFSGEKNFGDEKDKKVPAQAIGVQVGAIPYQNHSTFYSKELKARNERAQKGSSIMIQQNGVDLPEEQS